MPKHRVYIECFLGYGSILRYKKPAEQNIGIEIDREVLKLWKGNKLPNFRLFNADVIGFLNNEFYKPYFRDKETLIYCDPPYLKSVRRSNRQIYRCDMMKDAEHIKLLKSLLSLKCMVMISGYDSELYNDLLSDWRKVSFTGVSRAGATVEVVWMNFDEPLELHDYKFLGDDYRQRENIKRKKQRWINRLQNMKSQERYAFLSAFEDLKTEAPAKM
jgi:DNA adenine methylase